MKIFKLVSLLVLSAFLGACAPKSSQCSDFVTVNDGVFLRNNNPYYFVGTNFWYGAILGSQGEGGDRERLARELDQLKSIGVTNLRVLVGAEGVEGIWKKRIAPILQTEPGVYNDELLDGLDYFMAELQKRDMTAVLFLTNAWEWSGGFSQYLIWSKELSEDFAPENVDWAAYREAATKFVRSEKAKELFNNHIKFIISRTNRYTNEKYIDDPSIFSWQLCNEPRAFSQESKEFLYNWVDETSSLIRSLDPNHMISTGSEGKMGCENDIALFERIHSLKNISYINAHMWALNWKWLDINDMEGTIDGAIEKCNDYLTEHIAIAEKLKKPLVFEEFGLPRDNASIEKGSTTHLRDRLYSTVFDMLLKSHKEKSAFAGCNFWAWGGDAAQIPGQQFWQKGMEYCGDPAQEAQGLNSVYSDDKSTIDLIKSVTAQL